MSLFLKEVSGVPRGTTMALTDLPSIATATVLGNISGSSSTPSAVSLVSAATASTVMFRDINANSQINNLIENVTTTATAAGTTTLVVGSTKSQQFTGTTTQTVVLPNATTLANGQAFAIFNRSTGVVTVNANGGGLVQTMAAGSQTIVTLISNGTSAGTWDSSYSLTSGGGGSTTLTSLGIFSGKTTIGSGVTTISPTFSTAFGSTGYAVTCTLLNVTDTNPQMQPITITAQSTTGFTASWSDPTLTANYVLLWTAILNN